MPHHTHQMQREVKQPPTPVVITLTHSSPTSITDNTNEPDGNLKGRRLEEGGKKMSQTNHLKQYFTSIYTALGLVALT